jgi:hypothetical protein
LFGAFASIISIALAVGATIFGYGFAKTFTVNKLRYVDAVHKAIVPALVFLGAFLVASPIVWLLPFVGTGTAVLFGVGSAMGVAAGARDIRKRIGA